MADTAKNPAHRYVSDLRRLDTSHTAVSRRLSTILPLGLAGLFLALVALFAAGLFGLGHLGIAIGLATFGPKLIKVVGEQITRLNSPRAYCVALSAAITVLIATSMGLPVSSTHIAVGAVFGVGFLREYTENPNRRKLRPGHKLNATAEDAFNSRFVRRSRFLVRRRFLWSIAAAWVITVPATAALAAGLYVLLLRL